MVCHFYSRMRRGPGRYRLNGNAVRRGCHSISARNPRVRIHVKAGLLTRPCCRAFPAFEPVAANAATVVSRRGEGTYSSRYCSGFSPDSLFIGRGACCARSETLRGQRYGKIRKKPHRCAAFYGFRSWRRSLPHVEHHVARVERQRALVVRGELYGAVLADAAYI